MEPLIIEKERLLLVGFSFFGDPFATSGDWEEENEIGRLWSRFMAYMERRGKEIAPLLHAPGVGYELHITHAETPAKGHYEVFVGVEAVSLDGLPVDLLVKVLPPTQYAVFTLKGEEITGDWTRTIYREWLPASGYQEAYPYMFERYDERFKGMEHLTTSEIEVHVPVKPQ
ncbi:MAG: GyrI-like domain-containing protein [Anaerolineae bacterium]|jgi:predicted transcriptional regulator YdeE|nr:GyrI-like domain-containing protein [Anaerolineae bacterium]